MSMNQFMHPRNFYRQPPNFKQLAIEYPEFRKYVKQDALGKYSINFKDIETLRALSCTLLKKDFNLNIDIPLDRLVPTIPLRFNYILWIEDLLMIAKCYENIKGIDIGTGASCVYPLIGASKNKWSMVASEIDDKSIKFANENINKNSLNNFIKVVKVNGDTILNGIFENHPDNYDFCMCNPPFFASSQELNSLLKARKPDRPRPRNAFCASIEEVVYKGGEVDYIIKLINESVNLSNTIKIFTTMVGHKSSLPKLKQKLKSVEVMSFKQTEFCQGHTTRWGLAWTWFNIDLRQIPDGLLSSKHKNKPLFYTLPDSEEMPIELVIEKLQNLFQSLSIEIETFKQIKKNFFEFIIVAYSNTWSYQRRKKRELIRNNQVNLSISPTSKEIQTACEKIEKFDLINENNNSITTHKRRIDEDIDNNDDCDEFYNIKKIKTTYIKGEIFIKCKILIKKDATIILEFIFLEGAANKEAMHQILQYLKNNLMK